MNAILQKLGESKTGIDLSVDNVICGYYFDYRYGKDICTGTALSAECYAICFLMSNINQSSGFCINTYKIVKNTSCSLIDSVSKAGTWTYSFVNESATTIQGYIGSDRANWYTVWVKQN